MAKLPDSDQERLVFPFAEEFLRKLSHPACFNAIFCHKPSAKLAKVHLRNLSNILYFCTEWRWREDALLVQVLGKVKAIKEFEKLDWLACVQIIRCMAILDCRDKMLEERIFREARNVMLGSRPESCTRGRASSTDVETSEETATCCERTNAAGGVAFGATKAAENNSGLVEQGHRRSKGGRSSITGSSSPDLRQAANVVWSFCVLGANGGASSPHRSSADAAASTTLTATKPIDWHQASEFRDFAQACLFAPIMELERVAMAREEGATTASSRNSCTTATTASRLSSSCTGRGEDDDDRMARRYQAQIPPAPRSTHHHLHQTDLRMALRAAIALDFTAEADFLRAKLQRLAVTSQVKKLNTAPTGSGADHQGAAKLGASRAATFGATRASSTPASADPRGVRSSYISQNTPFTAFAPTLSEKYLTREMDSFGLKHRREVWITLLDRSVDFVLDVDPQFLLSSRRRRNSNSQIVPGDTNNGTDHNQHCSHHDVVHRPTSCNFSYPEERDRTIILEYDGPNHFFRSKGCERTPTGKDKFETWLLAKSGYEFFRMPYLDCDPFRGERTKKNRERLWKVLKQRLAAKRQNLLEDAGNQIDDDDSPSPAQTATAVAGA
ncbi:unnamed protein product [Amoebophrya sp. A120]|nr:unnamed protein product [Amoebophrya sp. A120]|eukprot:GSA120T00014788001.1